MAACRPYLVAQITAIRPKVIVAMGHAAIADLVGRERSMASARGEWKMFGATPVLPTYHPAAVLYDRRLFRTLVADLRKARKRAEGS